MKKYYEENPEARQQSIERTKKYFEDHPEARQQASEKTKKYFEDHPEARQKILDTKGKNKPFHLIKDGIIIETFTYQYQAIEYLQKEYNITKGIKISEVLSGKRNISAGFVFKYV